MKRTSNSIPVFAFPDNVSRRTMYLGKRQVPEIDGSQGAFIAVVVSLSVLIVVCCAAVFYLLRHHDPSDQERVARRERHRRAREQTLNSTSTTSGPSTSTSGSFGDKVKQVWQSTTGRGRGGGSGNGSGSGGGGGRRGGRGWIRAGLDDEWASRSGHEGARTDAELELGSDRRLRSPNQDGHAEGGEVRVVESPLSDSVSGYPYADPFAKMTSDVALQRSQSPLSSSSPVSSPSVSVEESPRPPGDNHDRRHRLTTSNGSVWTHAGSKFIEDI